MLTALYQRLLLGLLLGLCLVQCQKESTVLQQATGRTALSDKDAPTLYRERNPHSPKSGALVETTLGAQRPNPYAVANMTAAWNALYPEHPQTKLPITDLYVRFDPASTEELQAVEQAVWAFDAQNNPHYDNDPFLVDYPLHYEVTVSGDYYRDPSIAPDAVTPHYAVVKPDFVPPVGVAYTVLDELVLAPYSALLTMEAFRRLGVPYRDVEGQPLAFCDPNCPNYPACLRPDVDCSNGPPPPPEAPPYLPGWPHYPACLGIGFTPTSSGSPTSNNVNACGCTINRNPLYPSGCIRVEDTQLGWEGVRQVELEVFHWFKNRRVVSSGQGC